MALLSLIAALARNRVIGKDGGLPWHLPDDMRHFMRTTRGKTVVMGRKTWETLKGPLAHRENVIVTRNPRLRAEGATCVHSLRDALVRYSHREEIVVAGGEMLYAEALPLADRLYLTFVDAEFEGDVYFPEFDLKDWRETERSLHAVDADHAVAFSIVTLEPR